MRGRRTREQTAHETPAAAAVAATYLTTANGRAGGETTVRPSDNHARAETVRLHGTHEADGGGGRFRPAAAVRSCGTVVQRYGGGARGEGFDGRGRDESSAADTAALPGGRPRRDKRPRDPSDLLCDAVARRPRPHYTSRPVDDDTSPPNANIPRAPNFLYVAYWRQTRRFVRPMDYGEKTPSIRFGASVLITSQQQQRVYFHDTFPAVHRKGEKDFENVKNGFSLTMTM